MPALSAPSATVSSTSPAPCSKTARCSTPASRAKNALDKRWEVRSGFPLWLPVGGVGESAALLRVFVLLSARDEQLLYVGVEHRDLDDHTPACSLNTCQHSPRRLNRFGGV